MAENVQPKCPVPPILSTAYTAQQSKKRKTVMERATNTKRLNNERSKTRVNIGIAFQRWRELRELEGLKSDAMVAVFLLDRYSASRQSKRVLSPQQDHNTEGKLCNEASLLTEGVLDSEKDMCPPAELEIPVGLDSSEESQGSREDGDEEEEEEVETAVENRNEIDEEDTGTEKDECDMNENDDEWEMDEEEDCDMDEEDDEWEMDEEGDTESECEVNVVKKVRKRVRDNDNPDQPLRKSYVRHKRPETLCTNCGILYTTMKHTCLPNEKFRCSSCGCVFKSEMNLSIHRKKCKRSIHPCTFCFKPFKTREEKHNHETSHSEIQPYQCTECPQTFSDRLTRNRHLREHPKNIKCETCHKEFRGQYKLARHELSHSKDKPYKCQVCDRLFAQASQLKSHTRVHTGEKPFQCRLCPKTFNHNVSLKNHIRRYHQEESRDDPSPALKERRESNKYHSLDNQLEDRTEQERDGGLDMKVSRSLTHKELTFWADLDVPQGGSDGEGGERGEGHKQKRTRQRCLSTRHEELKEDSEEMVNDDSDFDPDEESVPSKQTRKGRGRGKLR
ncbi:zinc finger protein 37-like [Osmerus mordax]|uniref:zinc finger protein 37-like n=1 Tax=Osmerus mordax TaxID=8014 RepID=UPI00350FBD12